MKPINEKEEIEWGKKCSRLSTMILKGEFVERDDILLKLIEEEYFTKRELAICTHQYIIEQTMRRQLEKQKQQDTNSILYG